MEGEKEDGGLPSWSYWTSLAGSAATKLRSVTPDLTTAKNACAASYGYACRASTAVKDVINVPIQASRDRVSSWSSDPQNREVIRQVLSGVGVSAADEVLKTASGFVPGGYQLYRVTKAGATGFSRAYSRKVPEKSENKDETTAEGLAGCSALETIERKLQEMSSEMNELKMQNKMLKEKVSGLSVEKQPPLQPPVLVPEAVLAWQKPQDVIRVFITKGLKGKDLQSALLIPKFAFSDHVGK